MESYPWDIFLDLTYIQYILTKKRPSEVLNMHFFDPYIQYLYKICLVTYRDETCLFELAFPLVKGSKLLENSLVGPSRTYTCLCASKRRPMHVPGLFSRVSGWIM